MKRIILTAACLSFALTQAQESGSRVTGKVFNGQQPVQNALVQIKDGSISTETDANGVFILHIEPGVYTLEINADNLQSTSQKVQVASGTIALGEIQLRDASEELDAIVIEYYTGGEKRALDMRRKATAIMEVVSSDAIGKLPDINAAEAVQRVPGVSIERDQGEGRYVTVRGTPSQWSSSTINGNRMPSAKTSGDLLGNRTVSLDLLPTEFLDYVQVIKAITPEYEGDAIGGTINFIPKTAADKETFRTTLSSPFNLRAEETFKYNGNILYGNRYFNNKFGILALANYNQRSYATDSYEVVYGNELHNVNTLDVRSYQGTRTNTGFNVATDYRFNDNNKIFLRGYYTQLLDEERNRKTMHYFNRDTNNAVLRWNVVDYLFKNYGGEFGYEGKVTDNLKMKANAAHYGSWAGYNGPSSAEKNMRGYYYGNWVQTVKYDNMVNVDGKDYKFLQGDGPAGYQGDPANNVQPHFSPETPYNPDNYYLDRYVTSIRNVEEKDNVASLDFDWDANDDFKIKFGGKYRNKRSTYDYRYVTWIYDTNAPKAYLDNWEREAHPSSNWFPELNNNYDNLKFNYPTQGSFENPMGNPNIAEHLTHRVQDATNSSYATGNYDATENVMAAYVSGEYQLNDDFKLVGGFRYENTDVVANSYEFNDTTKEVTPIQGTKNYDAFLPMLHVLYKPSNALDIRAAVTRTFARPAFNEISPSVRVNPANLTVSSGNINLNPTFSWNYDLIGSYYLNSTDYITGGAFYKDITDLIYTANSQEVRVFEGATDLYNVSTPMNSEKAKLYGFEVGFNKKLDMLPGILSGFSLRGNYTFTKSETTLKQRGNEKVGLMNQSPNIFNVGLTYENSGFAARLTGNYRDTFLVEIRDNSGADRYHQNDFHLDLNVSYTTKYNLTFFVDLNNLTNQQLKYYHGNSNRPEQVEFYGLRGKLGASWSF